ncbi:hypothetical protein B0T10DRAFT_563626 [Thelonectria olida]|uniref:BTB domain-containing protein n=1 Tax=Thelonectria olida TaxID=1576542 RepID=A0A9P8W1F7_9HYPO|nr:hypothetical protein B0T10DRAFT_563626 [Thelonectria olida]
MNSKKRKAPGEHVARTVVGGTYFPHVGLDDPVKLVCQEEEFYVERWKICESSPVFEAAFTGTFIEATSNTYVINEFEIPTVRSMVEFLALRSSVVDGYLAYRQRAIQSEDLEAELKLFTIGDYFDISNLRKICFDKIVLLLCTDWRKEDFLKHAAEILGSTDSDELHDLVAREAAGHMTELANDAEFQKLDETEGFLKRVVGFIPDMIEKLVQKQVLDGRYNAWTYWPVRWHGFLERHEPVRGRSLI